jgi:hypothetical protein
MSISGKFDYIASKGEYHGTIETISAEFHAKLVPTSKSAIIRGCCPTRYVVGRAASLVFLLGQIEQPVGNIDTVDWQFDDVARVAVFDSTEAHGMNAAKLARTKFKVVAVIENGSDLQGLLEYLEGHALHYRHEEVAEAPKSKMKRAKPSF